MESFRATLVEDGSFHPNDERQPSVSTDPHGFRHYPLAGLREPIRFAHVSVREAGAERPCVHIVISTHYPRIADERLSEIEAVLRRHFPYAVLSFLLRDEVGFAQVQGSEANPSAAVAVATSKAACSWDESDPMKVAFDDASFAVSLRWAAQGWDAAVTRVVTSP